MNEVRVGSDSDHLLLRPDESDVVVQTVTAELSTSGLHAVRTVVHSYSSGFADLAGFFAQLVEDWRGWDGVMSWTSLEGDLQLEARHEYRHVQLRVILRAYGPGWGNDGRSLIAANGSDLHILAVTAMPTLERTVPIEAHIAAVAVTSDDTTVLVGTADNELVTVDLADGSVTRHTGPSSPIVALRVAPSGAIVSCGHRGELLSWMPDPGCAPPLEPSRPTPFGTEPQPRRIDRAHSGKRRPRSSESATVRGEPTPAQGRFRSVGFYLLFRRHHCCAVRPSRSVPLHDPRAGDEMSDTFDACEGANLHQCRNAVA